MDFQSVYPWAKPELIFETTGYTLVKVLNKLRNIQPFSKSGNETAIIADVCEDDELVCKDDKADKGGFLLLF